MMRRLLETSIAYALTRTKFGQAIVKFQGICHRVAHIKAGRKRRGCRPTALPDVARMRSASRDAAMTKLFVSESLLKPALETVQIHGGNGYRAEYEVERALRDAVGSTISSGTTEMQGNIIARWLGL